MDIILDTNIFRNDILLRSKDFDILMDYLSKTDSSIVIPQIVFEEIKGLYVRTFNERTITFNNALNNINLTLIDESKHIVRNEFDLESSLSDYIKYLKLKLQIKDKLIIPYKNDHLPEIVRRGIEREKPIGNKGQGFRDVLIWLTIKDYCLECLEKQIIFISNNDTDFANADKNKLHENLENECNNLGIKINYFNNIREFIEKHSKKLDLINEDWLRNRLKEETLKEIILDKLNGKDLSQVCSALERKTGFECTGYYNITNIILNTFEDIYVYEMVNNKLNINFYVECNVEIEFEFYFDPSNKWSDRENPFYYQNRRTSIDSKCLMFESYFSISAESDKVTEIELSYYGFY